MRPLLFATVVATIISPLGAQDFPTPRPCLGGDCTPVRPTRCGPANDCVRPINLSPRVVRSASRVRASLVNRVVSYEVTETFVNRGAGLGEADYLFPLPKGAAFQDLKLSINGELVAGEVLNATEARRVYEEIVRKQRDPALVEWMGYGLVRARIFPIPPGEEKRVVLRFTAVAEREGDAVRVGYAGLKAQGNGLSGDEVRGAQFELTYEPGSTYGEPFSPTHEVRSEREGATRRLVVSGGAGEVVVLLPVRQPREAAVSLLSYAPSSTERYALITLTPPVTTARRQSRDVTFVLDVSGSMSGRKLEQAKAAGRQLLGTLAAGDRFRVIAFSSDVRSFRDDFVPATREQVRLATEYLDGLDASGGTNISGALAEALRGSASTEGLPLVIFVTDGMPSTGEQRVDVIADSARAWRGTRRLFTFGLGADVNSALVERLALEGHGTAQFVRPEESVERAVSLSAQRLSAPLVTDLRVHAEGVRLVHTMPQLPVDVFAGQDLVVLTQVEGRGDATLIFEGRTADGPVRWTERVQIPERETNNAFVARLWATQRVGWLSAERRRQGGNRELDDELRMLGERYGIPTELTSYLVLEPGMKNVPMPTAGAGSMDAQARFESARSASDMRAAKSIAAADLMASPAAPEASAPSRRANGSAVGNGVAATNTKRVAGRTLLERDGTWWDQRALRLDTALRIVRVKPYSAAWFALADAVPELKGLLAAGEFVRVAGRRVTVVSAADGVETMSAADVARVVQDWGA